MGRAMIIMGFRGSWLMGGRRWDCGSYCAGRDLGAGGEGVVQVVGSQEAPAKESFFCISMTLTYVRKYGEARRSGRGRCL